MRTKVGWTVAAVALFTATTSWPAAPTCGVERWLVKTAQDARAFSVSKGIVPITVSKLNALPGRCSVGQDEPRIAGVETARFAVTAHVAFIKKERDGDYHIVLKDLLTDETLIAESPDPQCSARSWFLREIIAVRQVARHLRVGDKVRAVGIGFYDPAHGQRGMARSCIELHPLTGLAILGR